MTQPRFSALSAARWDAVHDWAGRLMRGWMQQNCTLEEDDIPTILDVGAGWGKYRYVLQDYPDMDAVEIWPETVAQENLQEMYRNVYVGDAYELLMDDVVTGPYHAAILGDVLEHMEMKRAKNTLRLLSYFCKSILAVIPYRYAQDEEGGNPYQRHIQNDLTPESVGALYPQLQLIALETRDWRPFKGMYLAEGQWMLDGSD